jgi:protein-S-isoprenylcysteine O-methyltransferase Ste14
MSQEDLPRRLTDRLERLEQKIDFIGDGVVVGTTIVVAYAVGLIVEALSLSPPWSWLANSGVLVVVILVYGSLLNNFRSR